MRSLKWLLCAIVLAIIVLIWLVNEQPQPMPAKSLEAVDTTGAPANENNAAKPKVAVKHESTSPTAAEPSPTTASSIAPEEKLRAVIEAKNVPIEFWGKVVDHSDLPLSGVKIESQIRHWDFTPGVGTSSRTVSDHLATSSDGLFHIGGASGDDLTIKAMEKGEYELEPNAKLGFGYSTAEQFTSRPEAPVIFRMWRKDIKESLITGEKSFQIEPDGRTYAIDLLNGAIAEPGQGDLKVWIKRPAQITTGQRFDWSCGIEAINGGLLSESNANSSMYSAPAEGYGPSFQWVHQASESGWSDSTGTQRFYLALRDGRVYGRIALEQFAYYNSQVPSRVRIQYAVNPSGSRILR